MPHRRPALLVVAAFAAAASVACTPISVPDAGSPAPATGGDGVGAGQCQPGWVCGTCPDGSSWGYLDDPRYTSDPQLSTLFFNDWHPCG